MDIDLNKEPLTEPARRQLISERDRILKKPDDDPRVWRAMRWLKGAVGGQMESMNVASFKASHADEYHSFVGTLDQMLEEWHQDTGKAATQEDVVKKIAPLIMQSQVSSTFFGLGPNVEEAHYREVPDEVKKDILAEAKKNGIALTDTQIRTQYYRQILKDKYGRAAAKPSGE